MKEIRNPKSEIRKKPEGRSPKGAPIRISDFGFRPSFGFRISDFGLQVLFLSVAFGAAAFGTEPEQPAVEFSQVILYPSQTNAPEKTAVRPARKLEETELRDLLVQTLNQKHGGEGAEWDLRLTRPWTALSVPDEPLTLEILEPAPNRITATSILRFELHAGHTLLGSWQTPVQARMFREILVAESPQSRGKSLVEANFVHERRDVLALRGPLADLPADAAAFEIAETVPAGAALTARSIRLKPVVLRGQTADAVVHDGAMLISLKVEVLEEGVPGQVIRVRNPQSRRELHGKVQNERTIAIVL
jgi:flagella basal body P-ring formation protein FlgA